MGGAGVYLCRDCADELMKNDFKMKKRSEKLRFFAVYLRFIRAASGGIGRHHRAASSGGKKIAAFEIQNQSVSNNSLGVISNFLQRKIIFS